MQRELIEPIHHSSFTHAKAPYYRLCGSVHRRTMSFMWEISHQDHRRGQIADTPDTNPSFTSVNKKFTVRGQNRDKARQKLTKNDTWVLSSSILRAIYVQN